LKTTFPLIGGHIVVAQTNTKIVFVGFLFPRSLEGKTRVYTLRYHALDESEPWKQDTVTQAVERQAKLGKIYLYNVHEPPIFRETHQQIGEFDIGRPGKSEAGEIRRLQQEIWSVQPEELYPEDIHGVHFHAGTSLVARYRGQVIGFLFGFYRFNPPQLPISLVRHLRVDLMLESQLLGVAPAFRNLGIGFLLKRQQALLALAQGIDIIQWTTDPLQLASAIFNFEKLGVVAFTHYPNHYALRDRLNQVIASRLQVTWSLRTEKLQQLLYGRPEKSRPLPLNLFDDVVRYQFATFTSSALATITADRPIAIEIPNNWTELQHRAPEKAQQWRSKTDKIFSQLLVDGKYLITNVAHEESRWYLVAQPIH
jgi:predicted GNAT superfamily acetyltransferase